MKLGRWMVCLLGLLAAGPALAQTWPTRSITLLVGFAPGGSADVVVRMIAPALVAKLGAAIVVENRAGASGIIAQEAVATAKPDGDILLFGSGSIASNASLRDDLELSAGSPAELRAVRHDGGWSAVRLGAKAAKPGSRAIVLHGDGSFGLNAMELDTAVRHGLPILVVISLNDGWAADPERNKAGRDLGYTRFDLMAQALGCHGEQVETADAIRPALERADAVVLSGRPPTSYMT